MQSIASCYESAGFDISVLSEELKETEQRMTEEPKLQESFDIGEKKWW